MAFYVDMYGEEYIKASDGKTLLHYDSTLSPVRVQYLAIKPIWGNDVDGWHTYLSHWRPTGGTACADEEIQVTIDTTFKTRDAAKAAAVDELKRDFRTMAMLGGY